jgi:hypothetical protein
MTTLDEQVKTIRSREDFIDFTRALLNDLNERPEQWGNADLLSYLEALCAWVEDMDGYYLNRGEPIPKDPNWMVFGQILLAARIYE